MKQRNRTSAAVAGGVAIGAAACIAVGKALWDRANAKAVVRLLAGVEDLPPGSYSPDEIAGLPAPVQRYFAFALTPGQPYVQRVRAVQSGEFRMGGIHSRWRPFTAVQHFTSRAPGFVWDAHIQVVPLLTVRVRDSYIRGTGAMQVRLASLLPLVNQSGKPDLATGALHRYLAEAVWLPTALLPSQGVVWQPIDDCSARATLADNGNSVSLDFTFGERGEIVRCYTATRSRDVKGASMPAPWACTYRNYGRVEGMMIPLSGEAEWILPEGKLPYCRMEIRRIEFNGRLPARTSTAARKLRSVQDGASRAQQSSVSRSGQQRQAGMIVGLIDSPLLFMVPERA
ncbi:MAG: hypothetical protein JWN14_3751 [Chthonomonadales bacterium]|nr:hypothetical protein [Chthonomonadales bacterium]